VTATGQRGVQGGPFAALAFRPYRWWFASQVLSASGLMTQVVATAWLVLRWHGNGLELSLLSTTGLGPMLLLGVWAGALIDHHDRRRLLICTQAMLATLSLVLYALIATKSATYPLLLAINAASGVVNAADAPARQIYVLDLVGEERVAGAVSLYEVILNLSRVFGPALGGTLLAVSGPAACVLVNAISFLAPLAVLIGHKPARSRTPREAGAARPKAIDGVRYAWSHPLLRACILLAVASGVVFSPTLLLPLMATRAFHLGGGGYGLLLALFGIGAVPGALLASRQAPTGRHVRRLAALTGAVMIIAASAPVVGVLYVAIVATGTASIWMIAAANTLVQLRAAPELRGRVMGAWVVALPGTIPLTGIVAGVVADAFGARVAFASTGAVIAAVGLACWRSFADDPGSQAAALQSNQ
jgi:MFS family permease